MSAGPPPTTLGQLYAYEYDYGTVDTVDRTGQTAEGDITSLAFPLHLDDTAPEHPPVELQSQQNPMLMLFDDTPSAYYNNTGGFQGFTDSGFPSALDPSSALSMFPPDLTMDNAFISDASSSKTVGLTSGNAGTGDGDPLQTGVGAEVERNDAATIKASIDSEGAQGQDLSSSAPGLSGVSGAGASGAVASGAAAAATTGSTITEFTKRKNWPAKVIEEMCDLLLIIEPNGRIRYTSPKLTEILGYAQEEALGLSLTDLVHTDDRLVFISELNACIANASVMRMFYRIKRRDGTFAVVESVGHAHIAESRFAPNPSNKSAFCQAVFLMSRPYPTKNASMLDSFLEHKMENERLQRRIDDLRHEDASEAPDDLSHTQSVTNLWRQSIGSRSDMSASETAGGGNAANAGTIFQGMPPPPPRAQAQVHAQAQAQAQAQAMGMSSIPLTASNFAAAGSGGFSNTALTRENLEGIAARRPDSLYDKMERYKGIAVPPGQAPSGSGVSGSGAAGASDGAHRTGHMGTTSHADTIEMLTGLRYLEGERSKGISTGNRSPRLVRGDVGITFAADRDERAGEKKKKIRLAEEYVCTDCGTLESPEWRKGPNGPKTLCNACGLRWAKKEKKERKKEQAAEAAAVQQWED